MQQPDIISWLLLPAVVVVLYCGTADTAETADTAAAMDSRSSFVPADAAPNTLVLNLASLMLSNNDGQLLLQPTAHAHLFRTNGSAVYTSGSLAGLADSWIELRLRHATQPDTRWTFHLYVVGSRQQQDGSAAEGLLYAHAPAGTVVHGLSRLSLPQPLSDVQYSLTDARLPLRLHPITHFSPRVTFCQLSTTGERLRPGLTTFVLRVHNAHNTALWLPLPVRLLVTTQPVYPPVFAQPVYFARVSQHQQQQLELISLTAHATETPVRYSLEEGSGQQLRVSPTTGTVYYTTTTTASQPQHNVLLARVVAVDPSGRRSSVPLLVELPPPALQPVESDNSIVNQRQRRQLHRRSSTPRPIFTASVPESYKVGQALPQSLLLGTMERVHQAPVSDRDGFLQVQANGTITFARPPNYETNSLITLVLTIENTQTKEHSTQQVRVVVEDVDEPPAFLNEPEPYLAVIKQHAPKHFSVYKFTARDENGDGDHRVEIKCINNAEFDVTPDGWVRSQRAGHEYIQGREYEVLVQAIDATNNSTKRSIQASNVAKLRVMAGSREPQFMSTQYEATVPEDTPVGATIIKVKANSFERPANPIVYSLLDADNGHSDAPPKDYYYSDKTFKSTNFDFHPVNQLMFEAGGGAPDQLFSIRPQSGEVLLNQALDYDDPKRARVHNLQVMAMEAGLQLQSIVPLRVRVADVNDNAPRFLQPLYSATVKESHPIGLPILKLSCRDADSGANARLSYTTDDDTFEVNDEGEVFATRVLDADQEGSGYHIYSFNVTAVDSPDQQGRALHARTLVHVRTENVNDESPHFIPTSNYVGHVAEDARGNTPITTIQAQDRDRDQVTYSFRSNPADPNSPLTQTFDNLFVIDKDTGLIKLAPEVDVSHEFSHNWYNLTVVAVDDGSCCAQGDPKQRPHTSKADVVISVTDVNSHKPVFPDCDAYSSRARILEGRHTDEHTIVQVRAVDEDAARNGEVFYSLYYSKHEARKPFNIDAATGELRPSPYVEFDREKRPFEDVTVKATDRGDRPLIGFCQFKVEVQDVNDNAPQFDRASYERSIYRMTAVGRSVVTVFADDNDAPTNANVTYQLIADDSFAPSSADDLRYFTMQPTSGEIILTQTLPADRDQFRFLVSASDNGMPEPKQTTVVISINIRSSQQSAPRWQHTHDCPEQATVEETVPINSLLFACYAQSPDAPDNPISYSMANGAKSSSNGDHDFREFPEKRNGQDWVIIRNLRGLDYEKTKYYNLTLTATDLMTGVSTDKVVSVVLVDKNDEVPKFKLDKFTGQVKEERMPEPSDPPAAIVQAEDHDAPDTPASQIEYRLLPGPGQALFRIVSSTGEIFPLQSFDREQHDSFILDVEASDGVQSDLPGAQGSNRVNTKVRIHVQDVNDNAPYFNRSTATGEVPEDAQENQNVMTIKAHDLDRDSKLVYSLELDDWQRANGDRAAFGVRAESGTIFVKERLDYEKRQQYNMVLVVMDGLHEARCNIQINLLDVNDNAPKFEQSLYEKTIREEDPNFPTTLLTVHATDLDKGDASRQHNIVYRLEGQGTPDFFRINNRTGEIQVVNKLDRDLPNGAAVWNFIAQAIDDGGDGLVGYADIRVHLTDINDNEPMFEPKKYIGFVEEEREPGSGAGVYIMQMQATDYDDPSLDNSRVTYSIVRNKHIDGEPVFAIDANTGKLFAKRKFDRESASESRFEIAVKAEDHGMPPLQGTVPVSIIVTDINDNPPTFTTATFIGKVSESAQVNAPVLTVSAQDPDDQALDNVLQYELVDEGGNAYFYMSTEHDNDGGQVGVLRVKQNQQPLPEPNNQTKPLLNTQPRIALSSSPARPQSPQHHAVPHVVSPIHPNLLALSPQWRPFMNYKQLGADEIVNNRVLRQLPRGIEIWLEKDVPENANVGSHVSSFDATGSDSGNYTYRINRGSDNLRQFSITQHTGILTVTSPLDREATPQYELEVEVVDSAGNSDSIRVRVTVDDVNDNAPEFSPSSIVIPENLQPGQRQTIQQVKVIDLDAAKNGPPFTFERVDTYTDLFSMNYDPRAQMVTVSALKTLDREGPQGKQFELKAVLSDAGTPPMRAERTLTVVVGDEPDNKMSDGEKRVHVYKYEKFDLPSLFSIGRVYVQDADDWDAATKEYTIVDNPYRIFQLQQSEIPGMLQMKGGSEVQAGNTYTVDVRVQSKLDRSDVATGRVTVTVESLEVAAMVNSGSIRLTGITDEQFIRQDVDGLSPMDRFKQQLAQYLDVDTKNVEVFSIMANYRNYTRPEPSAVLDVRFAVHNSPYRPAAQLNGFVQLYRSQLESILGVGVHIIQVNINECYYSNCDECRTETRVEEYPKLVNSNTTAVVGLFTNTTGTCLATCPAPVVPSQCTAGACKNGGICHDTKPGFFCECRGNYFGSRCEGISRSFDGQSFAWLSPPKKTCVSENVSVEFMTTQSDALLVYYGRMYDPSLRPEDIYAEDYLAIKLVGGRIQVELNVGTVGCGSLGKCLSTTIIKQSAPLNDGRWHSVDFHFESRVYTVVIDGCRDMRGSDQSTCRSTGYLVGDDERLNVVDPIQLGGVMTSESSQYPDGIQAYPKYNGCLRNLRWNNELLDLARPAYTRGLTQPGCALTANTKCGPSNTLEGAGYCLNGECLADLKGMEKCICAPGWIGERCENKVGWVLFDTESYIQYEKQPAPQSTDTRLQLLYVADEPFGQTAFLQGNGGHFFGTQMSNQRAVARVRTEATAGADAEVPVDLARGQPYWMSARQNPISVGLSLDELPGRYSAQTLLKLPLNPDTPAGIDFNPKGIYLGKPAAAGVAQTTSFRGCVGDFRIDGVQFPLTQPQQQFTSGVSIVNLVGASQACPPSILATCANWGRGCPPKQVCVDFWKGPFCTCEQQAQAVLDTDGKLAQCGAAAPVRRLTISNTAVIAIIICLFVLLLVVLLLVVYTRRRRPIFEEIRPEDDMRDNVVNYGVEGGGEEDQDTYNIGPLRKPVLPPDNGVIVPRPISKGPSPPNPNGEVGSVIAGRLREADKDQTAAPFDELRVYDDEGDATSIATLSSLGSRASQALDWDKTLPEWGPRFQKLADMYGSSGQQQQPPQQPPPPTQPKPGRGNK